MPRSPFPSKLLVLALALAGTLAGCLQPTATPGPGPGTPPPAMLPDWAARALVFGEGHDHTDYRQHQNLSTPNFHLLGWDPLSTDYFGKTAGGYLCGDATATSEGRRLAIVGSFTTDVAFVVVDVTDAAKPVKVGEYVMKGVQTYDAAMTLDGKHVLVAADSLGRNEDPRRGAVVPPAGVPGAPATTRLQLYFRDACDGVERPVGPENELPMDPGVVMVGIQDPKSPKFEDFQPTPFLGPHSVSTATLDGATYVVASITNLAHAASYFNFYQVTDTPAGSKLVLLSTVDSQQYGPLQTGGKAIGNGHVEALLTKHPATGKPVAYLCNWDGGLILMDLSNPRAPVQLSAWSDKQADGGAVHSAVSVEGLWDGRHYVIVGQEFIARPSDRPSGWIYVLDDTDPKNVKEVGRWTLPVDTQPDWGVNELFSTHYFALVNRTLFVTMYHGGVWAVDLSTSETLAHPRSVGVFVPANWPPNPPKVNWKGQIRGIPYVLDVFPYPDGTLVTFDATSGVYTFRFDASSPAPQVPEWPSAGANHKDG